VAIIGPRPIYIKVHRKIKI